MPSTKYSRRTWLKLSASSVGVATVGFGLRGSNSLDAVAAPGTKPRKLIVLWMNGGPSHLETFDPKPNNKASGPTKAIATSIKGVQFAQHLPQLAALATNLTVIRGLTSKEGNHQRARYLMHTGYIENPTVDYPSIGAYISHEMGGTSGDLPAHVALHGPGHSGGFLGAVHGPFVVRDAGAIPDGVVGPPGILPARIERRRRALLAAEERFAGLSHSAIAQDRMDVQARAFRLMRSTQSQAFDISHESQATRESYGESPFGRACLTARRLSQAGVPFVEVTLDGWDTHQDHFSRSAQLCSALDPALAALIGDLKAQDALSETLVVCMGEFGRTPRINQREGRDHHPAAFSALLCGGGARPGVVRGQTDDTGERVVTGAVTVPDLFATIGSLCGLDIDKTFVSDSDRPITMTDGGMPLTDLIS